MRFYESSNLKHGYVFDTYVSVKNASVLFSFDSTYLYKSRFSILVQVRYKFKTVSVWKMVGYALCTFVYVSIIKILLDNLLQQSSYKEAVV